VAVAQKDTIGSSLGRTRYSSESFSSNGHRISYIYLGTAAEHFFGVTNSEMEVRWKVSQTDLAPSLSKHVPKRILKWRTGQGALLDNTWVCDIKGDLSDEAILE